MAAGESGTGTSHTIAWYRRRQARGDQSPAAHNDLSYHPTPSAEDRTVTRQLVAAGQLLDLPLHDHVIIAGDRFTSFAAQGLL